MLFPKLNKRKFNYNGEFKYHISGASREISSSFFKMNNEFFKLLHHRLGTTIFSHLINHTNILLRMQNDVFLQLFEEPYTKTPSKKNWLNRKELLYNSIFYGKPTLPKNHVLLNKTAKDLVNHVWGKKKKIPKRLKGSIVIFSKIKEKASKCGFLKIINEVCPDEIDNSINILSHCITYKKVYRAITKYLNSIIPFYIWGSKHNYNIIKKHIYKIVSLRKNETLDYNQVFLITKITDSTRN